MAKQALFAIAIITLTAAGAGWSFYAPTKTEDAGAHDGFIPYKREVFSEAIASGKTLVVHVHADWCPACKQQVPVLKSMASEKAFSDVAFVRVNYDTQKDFLAENRVPVQSIILVFKDGQRKAAERIIGVVAADALRERIENAVI